MKKENVRLFRTGDIFAFAFIICLFVFLILFTQLQNNGTGDHFTVNLDGVEHTYSLKENKTYDFSCNGHNLTVQAENGKVSVISSDCPDKVCINSGAISSSNQMIVCAPAKISISIQGENNYDTIVK